VWGVLALQAISQHQFLRSFWLMGAAILVDAVDGVLARAVDIKHSAPQVDGALLDNVLDYLNYVVVPAFFLLESPLVPPAWRTALAGVVVLASAYQFSQVGAKTADHFFKGFPSYWNLVVFYGFMWQLLPRVNVLIVVLLALLVFAPVKYVYPTRLGSISQRRWVRQLMLWATILWGVASTWLLWTYPHTGAPVTIFLLTFMAFYVGVSLYRTWVPLKKTG